MKWLLPLLCFAEDTEERVNITPVLLRFTGKFFLIFAAVAVIALLTPWLAKKIDTFREAHAKPAVPEDPRCKAVRGPYDMPEPKQKEPEQTEECDPSSES